MANLFSKSIESTSNRIQSTSDLMPSDILGTEILDVDEGAHSQTKQFRFIKGPVFANILLADEINRATPKTQSALLEAMPPYQGGGDMIRRVTFQKTEFADIPGRFEAGTPHIAGAYGLAAAIDYVTAIGMEAIAAHERDLLEYATGRLQEINSLRLIGTADQKAGIISFELDGVHAHDIGTVLDREGIAVRVGHHCAQPVMDHFGIAGTVRASFGLYNDKADIDALVQALGAVREIFD